MTLLDALILGIVEGVTEFLPVSSTGHLILTSKLLGLSGEFNKTFEIAIQSGAILAVLLLYGKNLVKNRELMQKTLAAFIPTAILGYIFYKLIKAFLLDNVVVTISALFTGGIVLILYEKFVSKQTKPVGYSALTYKKALLIGVVQSLAMVPGVSRSAATILGGLSVGLNRKTAVEFSFLLAIPTLLSATILDLSKSYSSFTSDNILLLLIGTGTSTLVAAGVMKWFLRFVEHSTFIPFGIYRIIASILFFLILL